MSFKAEYKQKLPKLSCNHFLNDNDKLWDNFFGQELDAKQICNQKSELKIV